MANKKTLGRAGLCKPMADAGFIDGYSNIDPKFCLECPLEVCELDLLGRERVALRVDRVAEYCKELKTDGLTVVQIAQLVNRSLDTVEGYLRRR